MTNRNTHQRSYSDDGSKFSISGQARRAPTRAPRVHRPPIGQRTSLSCPLSLPCDVTQQLTTHHLRLRTASKLGVNNFPVGKFTRGPWGETATCLFHRFHWEEDRVSRLGQPKPRGLIGKGKMPNTIDGEERCRCSALDDLE